MPLDKLFQDEPFSYIATKSGLIQISYNGKVITKLNWKRGSKFLVKVEEGDSDNAQLVMAKASGHFKQAMNKYQKTVIRNIKEFRRYLTIVSF